MNSYITTTRGLSGYYAVLIVDGCPEQTGVGRYETEEEAQAEAYEWAESEGLKVQS